MTKLCPRGKAAAKRKFRVYPSAYANAYASKICAGKIKDPSGVKRKDFRGPKPSGAKVGMAVTAGAQSGIGRLEKSGIKKTLKGARDFYSAYKRDKAKVKKANKGKLMIIIGVGKAKKRDKMKVQKKMGGGLSAATEKLKAQGLNKGGDAKIKKVISGLHKASALHKGQAKSLQTVVKKSGGGMARGAGAAIRGTKFQGVF